MIVGIDIDGVLFPWADLANEAVVEWFGVPDPGPHVHWTHIKECISGEQWAWLWSAEGQNAVFGRYDRVYPGVVEAFNRVLRVPNVKTHFVTHRDPRRTAGWTAQFLQTHFGDHPWAGLHIVQNSVAKRTLARWDVFVDDKPDTVWDFVGNTNAKVFCPRRPWNEEVIDDFVSGVTMYDDPSVVAEWIEGAA